MTIGEAKIRTLKLMQEYSEFGRRIAENAPETADWRMRMPELFCDAQRETALVRPLWRRMEIPHFPPKNRLRGMEGTLVHGETDLTAEGNGVRAYAFRVLGSFTAYLEVRGETRWTAVRTFSEDTDGEFRTYRGRLDATAERARLRFTGAYRYLVQGAALYAENFSRDAEIPLGGESSLYTLPADYLRFGQLRKDGENCENFRWHPDGMLELRRNAPGCYLLEYAALPAAIESDASPERSFETDEFSAGAIPYYAASLLLAEEDPEASERLWKLWETKLERMEAGQAVRQTRVREHRKGERG